MVVVDFTSSTDWCKLCSFSAVTVSFHFLYHHSLLSSSIRKELFILIDLLDKPRSQVSSLPPPRAFIFIAHRVQLTQFFALYARHAYVEIDDSSTLVPVSHRATVLPSHSPVCLDALPLGSRKARG